MDTKKLRQKILDLAIHGKLVPQDPNDEPASVLLERIRKEKELLIKEGKIKAPKKNKSAGDTSHYPKDGPWELPEGWCWATIGDVFIHNTGKALNSADREGQSLSYITTSNLYWDRFELSNLKEMLFTKDELEKCTARKGDLLVCEGGDIGRAAVWDQDYEIRIQNHIHKLRGLGGVNHRLFMFWLMYMKEEGMIGGKGIGLMGLSSRELDKLLIPLLPLCEQFHLVDKIDDLFSVVRRIEKTGTVLSETVSATKSRILDLAMRGKLVPQDPSDEPAIELLKQINPNFKPSHNLHYDEEPIDGWVLVPFKEVFDSIPSKPYQIALSDVKDNGRFPVISQGAKDIDGYSDDIERVFRTSVPVYVFGDHTKVLKYVSHDFIVGADGVKILKPRWDSKYLFYNLLYYVSNMENRGYSRNYQYLSSSVLHIPPVAEQNRIVSAIELIFKELDSISIVTT